MTDRLAGLVLPDNTPIDEAAPRSETGKSRMWRRKDADAEPAPTRQPPRRKPVRKSGSFSAGDVAIVGTGLALAFACAVFPWYIFFHKEQFGTRAISFGERVSPIPVADLAASEESPLAGKRLALPEGAFPTLDLAATGTVSPGGARTAPESQQPFPGAKPDYRLVLVANGRGMIADKDGYWMIAPGAWLPDGSRVKRFEKRGESWVLVTSNEAVVPLAE